MGQRGLCQGAPLDCGGALLTATEGKELKAFGTCYDWPSMCPGQCIRTGTVMRTELEPRAGIRMTDGRVVGHSAVGQKG